MKTICVEHTLNKIIVKYCKLDENSIWQSGAYDPSIFLNVKKDCIYISTI
jgi:hypothetical protein